MKKLMIAAAIVCTAVMSQAAGYSWKSGASGGILYDGTSSTKLYATAGAATLYLFTADTITQEKMFTELAKGTDISTLGAVASTALTTASKITTKDFENSSMIGNKYDFFFATVFKDADGNDAFYISSLKEQVAYGSTSTASIQYTDLGTTSKATFDVADGYQGAGVYASVPEPTSGLLLLLGVAGMALRRRRA